MKTMLRLLAMMIVALLALAPAALADHDDKGKGKDGKGKKGEVRVRAEERDDDDDDDDDRDEVRVRREVRVRAQGAAPAIARVERDVDRVEALLIGVSRSAVAPSSLRSIANEANALANRIAGNVRSAFRTKNRATALSAAGELKTHVRLMRKAVLAGDADGARRHAREALTFAVRIDDLAG